MTFDKRGDRLLVSNEGTDPAVGSFNTAPGVFRAAVLNGLLPTIAYDQYLCAAGVLRQIDFDLTAGAITTASHPSAVSTSMGSLIAINQAHCLGGKMLSGDAELARTCLRDDVGPLLVEQLDVRHRPVRQPLRRHHARHARRWHRRVQPSRRHRLRWAHHRRRAASSPTSSGSSK